MIVTPSVFEWKTDFFYACFAVLLIVFRVILPHGVYDNKDFRLRDGKICRDVSASRGFFLKIQRMISPAPLKTVAICGKTYYNDHAYIFKKDIKFGELKAEAVRFTESDVISTGIVSPKYPLETEEMPDSE